MNDSADEMDEEAEEDRRDCDEVGAESDPVNRSIDWFDNEGIDLIGQ